MEDVYERVVYTTGEIEEEGYLAVTADMGIEDLYGKQLGKVGFALMYIFDKSWENDEFEWVADSIDEDTYVLMGEAARHLNVEDYFRVAILDRLVIEVEYQNKGYGSKLLDSLTNYLEQVLNVDMILVTAISVQKNVTKKQKEQLTGKLKGFYENKGYKRFSKQHMYRVNKEKIF